MTSKEQTCQRCGNHLLEYEPPRYCDKCAQIMVEEMRSQINSLKVDIANAQYSLKVALDQLNKIL